MHCSRLMSYNKDLLTYLVSPVRVKLNNFNIPVSNSTKIMKIAVMALALVLNAKIQVHVLGLGLETQSLALALALTVVLGFGRRLEKIITHYIDTIKSLSFDSDTKLEVICGQIEFVPLDNCSREFLLFLPV